MLTSCSVSSVYSKTAGKNARHAWVSDCSSIAAASNIPTQVYQYMSGARQFRAIPESLQRLHVPQFALIPSPSFLCLLSSSQPINSGIRISTSDGALFKKLEGRLSAIVVAVKSLGARKMGAGKGKQKAAAQNVGSDGEESDFPEHLATSWARRE
ncbi:hypothetical protein DFH09DRAFT_920394 [Mycena vulgaris]|nr:hypothetical protein DFH09DRAFT_920394 [Mycena vulgaris]